MTKLYLVHDTTKRRFEVMQVDRENERITLKGEHATFDEKYDPPRFKQLGYRIEKVDE